MAQVGGSQLYGEGNDTVGAAATDGDNGSSQAAVADSFGLTAFRSGNTPLEAIATAALGGGSSAAHN